MDQSTTKKDPERLAPITPEREDEAAKQFIKDKQNNMKKVFRVLAIILVANLVVAGTKVILGLVIKSTSLTADGFHSVSDSFSNVVGMVALHFAMRPDDEEHPYGHTKIETLTGAGIGLVLVYLGIRVVLEAIHKFQNPSMPQYTIVSLVMIVITVAINIFVARYERKQGEKLDSAILISDSAHTKSDIFISIGVLAGLVVMKLGLPAWLDPLISLIVAGFIFHAAWEVFSQNANVLIDGTVLDEDFIERKVMKFKHVKGVHRIRSRGTLNRPFIDMHVIVDPDLTVRDIHRLEHQIEDYFRRLLDAPAGVMCHFEPCLKELGGVCQEDEEKEA